MKSQWIGKTSQGSAISNVAFICKNISQRTTSFPYI